ncbi:unnamed protein product, partial [Amoebophrya sp. A25]
LKASECRTLGEKGSSRYQSAIPRQEWRTRTFVAEVGHTCYETWHQVKAPKIAAGTKKPSMSWSRLGVAFGLLFSWLTAVVFAVHESRPHVHGEDDRKNEYETLYDTETTNRQLQVQAGNRGFGLQFDGKGRFELDNFPPRLLNEFSALIRLRYSPSWLAPASEVSSAGVSSGSRSSISAAFGGNELIVDTSKTLTSPRVREQVLLAKGGVFQFVLRKDETRTDLAYPVLKLNWDPAQRQWEGEFESRQCVLTAFQYHDFFFSFSEREI